MIELLCLLVGIFIGKWSKQKKMVQPVKVDFNKGYYDDRFDVAKSSLDDVILMLDDIQGGN